jgi:hypothetical protein
LKQFKILSLFKGQKYKDENIQKGNSEAKEEE